MANYDFTYKGAEIQAILDTAKKLKDSGYIFLGVATPSTNPGTPTQKVYYEAKQAGTYTNFGGVVLPDGMSLLIWNGSWTSETVMCGDGGVFDISVYKSTGGTLATYADLAAALDGGNNIPVGVRKGGMSVKFVQSSDNKYVQARCMAQNFTTDVTQWQSVDNEPTAGSDNLVKSGGVADLYGSREKDELYVYVLVDSQNKLLKTIDKNGKETIYIYTKFVGDVSLNNASIKTGDFELLKIQDFEQYVENGDYLEVLTDKDNKLIKFRKMDGSLVELAGIETTSLKTNALSINGIDILDYISNQELKLKKYHVDAVGSYINELFTLQNDNSFTIAFMTDFHLTRNDFTPKGTLQGLMAYGSLIGSLFTDCNIMGGDYTDTVYDDHKVVTDEDVAYALRNCIQLTNPALPKIMLRGNHEFDDMISQKKFHDITSKLYPKNTQTDPSEPNGSYGYVDYDNKKVRVIFLDTTKFNYPMIIPDAQFDWYVSEALDMSGKTDWVVVICSHHGLWDTTLQNTSYRKVTNAFHRGTSTTIDGQTFDFTSQGAIAMFWLAGHVHQDYSSAPNSTFDFLTICTTDTSTIWDTTLQGHLGTVEECVFDTLIVDTNLKTIQIKRYGYGNDRSFSFD